MSETPEQRRQLKRRYQEILLYLNQIAEKTGLSAYQIADCAAGNVQLGRTDTQKILDAFESLDAPERGDTNKKKPSMPRSKNSPNTRGEPSITPDRAIQLLWEQIEKGRHLETLSPLHTGDFENWDNTTKNIVEWAFGENHRNVDHFAYQEAPTTYLAQSANQLSARHKEELHLKIPALVGYIEQLKMKSSESLSGLPETAASSSKVFIVHGHNKAIKYELAHSLQNAGVDVTILDEQTNEGRTILEKLADHATEAGFAVVLLSADDVGRAKSETVDNPRARQNVVFELGLFCGLLGRKRVCAVREKGVEMPSDLHGLVYIEYDPAGSWKHLVAKEINSAGIKVDFSKL